MAKNGIESEGISAVKKKRIIKGFSARSLFVSPPKPRRQEDIMESVNKLIDTFLEHGPASADPNVLRIKPGLLSDGQIKELGYRGISVVEEGKVKQGNRAQRRQWRQG